jgi:hypothetical protein
MSKIANEPRSILGEGRLSIDERVARGRAARDAVPRGLHARWEAAPDRPDPVSLLESQAQSRLADLTRIRYGRMVASPFSFYRGAAIVMTEDLGSTPSSSIRTQLCGDAHLSNFGVFASPERTLVFDLNDFDGTTRSASLRVSASCKRRPISSSVGSGQTTVATTTAGSCVT